jgi:hypothetical protein
MEKNVVFPTGFLSMKNGEKIRYMKNGEKSGVLSPKNAGTWRKSCGIPDAPADYVRRPPRPGKLVEPVLAEEGCRM